MLETQPTLTFLIPTYKRPKLCARAVNSVLSQITAANAQFIHILVCDDASPDFSPSNLISLLNIPKKTKYSNLQIKVNSSNLGMSANILHLVDNIDTDYYTILTDDDFLLPFALEQIITVMSLIKDSPIYSFYVPRHCFTDDGSAHSIECQSSQEALKLHPSSPSSSIQFSRNAFILTGHFYSRHTPTSLWRQHIDNSFFPVLHYAESLLNNPSLFLNKNWFSHTVDNECFWESWGSTSYQQNLRLYSDFLSARHLVFCHALKATQKTYQYLVAYLLYAKTLSDDTNELLNHTSLAFLFSLPLKSHSLKLMIIATSCVVILFRTSRSLCRLGTTSLSKIFLQIRRL